MQKKNLTIVFIITTVFFALVAVFLVIRLNKKTEPVKPKLMPIEGQMPEPAGDCTAFLKIIGGGPTSTPGPSSTPTPHIVDCYIQCESDTNCSSSLSCLEVEAGIKRCVNSNCSSERDCYCGGPTPTPGEYVTPTPGVYVSPTPVEYQEPAPTPITIPPVGIVEDTFLGLIAGFSFLIIALLFAL